MISYEKEVISFLGLPSIPKREFDGSTPFDKGVAIVEMYGDREAYAACTYNPDRGHTEPVVTKVFGIEPFFKIKKIFVVPDYMSNAVDIEDMDLDEESKTKAREILDEAKELENEGVEHETVTPIEKLPEWVFPEITSKEEAMAWLKRHQAVNHIKGRIPTTEENIKLRLYSIYTELQLINK